MGDRLDQHRLPRQRATIRPYRAIARQTACWAAKRQARLAELGFAGVEEYLRVRRVEQRWSLRHMLTELHVAPAWLKRQMVQLQIPDPGAAAFAYYQAEAETPCRAKGVLVSIEDRDRVESV